VAKNLEALCMEFSSEGGYFDEVDFIEWVNKYKYPFIESVYVESLGWCQDESEILLKYRDCKRFNFFNDSF